MVKIRLYIAHPIEQRFYVRDTITKELQEIGIEVLNPFYNNNGIPREDIRLIDEGKLDPFKFRGKKHSKEIVDKDLKLIQQADGVLAIMGDRTIGTCMEIFYCSYVLKKPVYIITDKYYGHVWLVTFGRTFKSLEQFKKWYMKRCRNENM